jgi:hypothetical protein
MLHHMSMGRFDLKIAGMAENPGELAVRFSPFCAIVQGGLGRVMEFVESEEFRFVVEGREIVSTLAEAVLISPRIYESVQGNRTCRRFEVESDVVASHFKVFLEFVRNRNFEGAERSEVLKHLMISGRLGNDRLSFALLASMNFVWLINGHGVLCFHLRHWLSKPKILFYGY